MGPNLEFCALTRGNLRVCEGSNFSSFEDKLQIINGTIIGRNGVVCCLRMTALRPVIVVRWSVQKPAPSARGDSARLDRPATVGIVLAPCRTPAAAAPKQPFRPDRRPAIKQRAKTVGRSPTVFGASAVEAVPATRRPHRRGGAETL